MTDLENYYAKTYQEQVRLKNEAVYQSEIQVDKWQDEVNEVVENLEEELSDTNKNYNMEV